MTMQTWTWTLGLVVVAITVLTGVASGVAPPSPVPVAPVDFEDGWLCVGPAGSFRESFEVPGSSLALTTAGIGFGIVTATVWVRRRFNMDGGILLAKQISQTTRLFGSFLGIESLCY